MRRGNGVRLILLLLRLMLTATLSLRLPPRSLPATQQAMPAPGKIGTLLPQVLAVRMATQLMLVQTQRHPPK